MALLLERNQWADSERPATPPSGEFTPESLAASGIEITSVAPWKKMPELGNKLDVSPSKQETVATSGTLQQ